MTEQQQKLYDKLLKKVNEYCLGAAAEDVIAAIDALVENYETIHTTLCTITTELSEQVANNVKPKVDLTSKPLEVWSLVKKYMNAYHHRAVEANIDVETVEGYPISIIEDSLKALEIIYTKEVDINWLTLQFEGADIKDVIEYVENYPTMCSDKPLTADEVTLLKEIYDDIL